MARIPSAPALERLKRSLSETEAPRPLSELPPQVGYLQREMERLPSGEVSPGTEFPMLSGGRAARGRVADLLRLVRDETNDAAANAAKIAAEAVGGGGRKTFERSVSRATSVTPTSGDKLLAVRDGKAVSFDVGDISGGGGGGPVDWDDVQDKPAEFPPEAHTHPISDVTGLQTALNGKAATSHTHAQSEVTNLVSDLAAKAPLASPALTGNPTAPTQSPGNNSTRIATTAYTDAAIAALVASAPGVLDTLDEIAAALGDDANFAATMTTALAGKQPLDSDLTAIAALTTTSYGRALLTLANGAALKALLTINAADIADATANGRSLITAANYSAMRTLLGLVIGTDVVAQSHVGSGGSAHADVVAAGASGFMTGADKTKLDGIAAGADVTSASNVGSATNGATAKATPVDADGVGILDSAASNALKKSTWGGVKTWIKSWITKADVGLGNIDNAWTAYTPTVTSGTGTITTLGTVTGRYVQFGKIVIFLVRIPITTNGTGNSSINFTLPVTAAAAGSQLNGAENALTGKLLNVFINTTTIGRAIFADGTYPGANGAVITASGVYEAA